MTKPTSCHYKSVPISHHFLCLVGTMRSESVRFTRGGHSYALCSSTCDHIQHVFMWLRYTVAFQVGSKVKASFSQSIYSLDNLYDSLIRVWQTLPQKVKYRQKISNSQGQFRMVKILDHSCGWNYTVHSDHPLFHL